MSSATDSSEPLLAGHPEHDDIDLSPRPKRPSLLQSRYVVACALYASIGGLIFGYGKPNLNTEYTNSRPRNRLCNSRHAAFPLTLPNGSPNEGHADLVPRTR